MSKLADIGRWGMVVLIVLWGLYWVCSPLLFGATMGFQKLSQVWLGFSLLTLRGLAFLWLAYALARRRYGQIMIAAIILIPLCLTDFLGALKQGASAQEDIMVLIISLIPWLIVVGVSALFWRFDRARAA